MDGRVKSGHIVVNESLESMQEYIEAGRILAISGLWDESQILVWRKAAFAWSKEHAVFPKGKSASVPGLSFHRYDDEKTSSYMSHVFHQIGLSEESHGDDSLWSLTTEILEPLLEFQNRLSGTNISLSDNDNRIKVYNHPVGGGFLEKHQHPRDLLGAAFFLSLSRPGVDYQQGDVVFEIDSVDVPAGDLFAAGNALFFRYDLPHQVTPVNPESQRDWSDQAGLWVASLEPVKAYHLSSKLGAET